MRSSSFVIDLVSILRTMRLICCRCARIVSIVDLTSTYLSFGIDIARACLGSELIGRVRQMISCHARASMMKEIDESSFVRQYRMATNIDNVSPSRLKEEKQHLTNDPIE
jgi:hypothetical protein